MPQRDHQNTPNDSSSEPSGVITSFDELTKGLATGAVSRRKAPPWPLYQGWPGPHAPKGKPAAETAA